MLKGTDDAAFGDLMKDLCLAFGRQYSPELGRVFWETLKHVSLPEFRRACEAARKNLRKFPTPKDLIPERRYAPAAPPDVEPFMSKWAIAANKALFACAYTDKRRGFKPVNQYPPMPAKGLELPLQKMLLALDAEPLKKMLAIKADYVAMAEQAEAEGAPMTGEEFSNMCREGFSRALGA